LYDGGQRRLILLAFHMMKEVGDIWRLFLFNRSLCGFMSLSTILVQSLPIMRGPFQSFSMITLFTMTLNSLLGKCVLTLAPGALAAIERDACQ